MDDEERLSIGARLLYALILPWKLLFNGVFAARVKRAFADTPAKHLEPAEENKQIPEAVQTPTLTVTDAKSALQLLAILQREGRLIDFLQEDVTKFTDAQIGAAARVVHEGCKRSLEKYLHLTTVRSEREGDEVILPEGFDSMSVRITGNVVGQPPFHGRLTHHGWQVTKIELPTLSDRYDARIIAPAEVEL